MRNINIQGGKISVSVGKFFSDSRALKNAAVRKLLATSVCILGAGMALANINYGGAAYAAVENQPQHDTGANKAQDQTLTLLTEENAPYNFHNQETGELDGSGVVLVRELMRKADVAYSIKLLPWRRAYRQAMNDANTCVFVTNRTPDREELFQWIGPVTESEGGWVFYKRPDSDIVLNSIEDAAKYIVVGLSGGAPLAEFQKQTGAEVLASPTGKGAVELLYFGRAELWLAGAQDGPFTAKRAGLPAPVRALGWHDYELYLACQKNLEPALVSRLNRINSTLRDLRIRLSKTALAAPQ